MKQLTQKQEALTRIRSNGKKETKKVSSPNGTKASSPNGTKALSPNGTKASSSNGTAASTKFGSKAEPSSPPAPPGDKAALGSLHMGSNSGSIISPESMGPNGSHEPWQQGKTIGAATDGASRFRDRNAFYAWRKQQESMSSPSSPVFL